MQLRPEQIESFFSHMEEHLMNVEQHLIHQQASEVDIAYVFREIHTLKGDAGILGIERVEKLTHELESYVDALRKPGFSLMKRHIDIVMEGVDILFGIQQEADLTVPLKTDEEQWLENSKQRLLDLQKPKTELGRLGAFIEMLVNDEIDFDGIRRQITRVYLDMDSHRRERFQKICTAILGYCEDRRHDHQHPEADERQVLIQVLSHLNTLWSSDEMHSTSQEKDSEILDLLS